MLSTFVKFSTAFVTLATLLPYVNADCEAYGIDFQNGGTYFINSADTSNFTTVTQFTGCTGTADVILVAPNEDSWLCSDIPTQPDNTNQVSTCPIKKSDMYSGSWTIVVLDNNGADPSFASQRTFTLTVGQQKTVTYTPTVNMTNVITPSATSTVSTVFTDAKTANASTITKVSGTAKNTITITPSKVTTNITTTSTRTVTSRTVSWGLVITTKTASCSIPAKPTVKDPYPGQALLALAQSVTSSAASATVTPSPSRRDVRVPVADILGRRAVERHLRKRAPDVPTVTITDSSSTDWITSTVNSTTSTTTFFTTTTSTLLTTITPAPVTVLSGVTTLTVTAPTPTTTRTIQTYTVTTITLTLTPKYAITITKTATPSGASCTSKGGSYT